MSRSIRGSWVALLFALGGLGLVRCTGETPGARSHEPVAREARPLTRASPLAPAFLVQEFDAVAAPTPSGPSPERPRLRVGAFTYFTVSDRGSGTELWKTDGTATGTSLVRDLCPGVCSSSPGDFFAFEGRLYFTAEDPGQGRELWRTDGTALGTTLVVDLYPGAISSFPSQFVVLGSRFLFFASSAQGSALWTSDGSAAGTTRLVDGLTAYESGFLRDRVAVVNGVAFFPAKDASHGEELWRSDGSAAGTRLVKDIYPGGRDSEIHLFTRVGDRLFFVATDGGTGLELWVSDGTEPGTRRVEDIRPGALDSEPASLTEVGGLLYFTADDGGTGRELYRSDGTEAGTFLLKDLWPMASSEPEALTNLNGALVFSAFDATGQRALWRSDGTAGGTQVIAASVFPVGMEVWSGVLYFLSRPPSGGLSLWRSEGTAASTVSLAPLVSTGFYEASAMLAPLESSLALWVEDHVRGQALWRSDGSASGTTRVRDFSASASWNAVLGTATAELDGSLYFVGSTPESGAELWKTRGTPESTVRVKDITPGAASSSPRSLTVLGNRLYFWANRGAGESAELWTSDGSEPGTRRLASLTYVGPFGSESPFLVAAGSTLYFTAQSSNALWTSDGTAQGTARLLSFGDGRLHNLTAVGSTLYFSVTSFEKGQTLWKSNGTVEGTVQLKQVGSFYGNTPALFTAVGSSLYFWSLSEYNGTVPVLWTSDGTPDGTRPLASLWPAGLFSSTDITAALGGELVFAAERTDRTGFELWKSNGTPEGTRRVTPLGPYSWYAAVPASFTVVDGRLFFLNNDGEHGYELWTSDGTSAGTRQVKDVAVGPASAIAARQRLLPLGFGGEILFAASDGLTGLELWRTDGTEAGTSLVQDLAPGAASSNPRLLGASGRAFLFQADDGTTGSELWALANPHADVTAPTIVCPVDQVLEADTPSGALAVFPEASATDDRTAVPRLRYSPERGTPLALGGHVITATALDAAGNSASCTFALTVRDTTPPTIRCPQVPVTEATQSWGAVVFFPAVTATDAVTTRPSLAYSVSSGSRFALGVTPVTVTATDGVGLTASCTLSVSVQDTRPPVLVCPAEQVREATSAEGGVVNYPPALATDAVSTPRVDSSPASGSTFPLGSSSVQVTATDAAGHASQCVFRVRVEDHTPPTLSCPEDVRVVTSADATGESVTLPAAAAQDLVSAVSLTYQPASGSRFPVGPSVVQVRALDTAGNATSCQFRVVVERSSGPDAGTPDAGPVVNPPPPVARPAPTPSGGCQAGGGTALPSLLLAWGLLVLDGRRRTGSR